MLVFQQLVSSKGFVTSVCNEMVLNVQTVLQAFGGIIHCKKSWWKTPPAWSDVTDSLVRGTKNFFDMKIELIRRDPTTKTEYFEIIGISRWFFVLPWRSFQTIFRQLSNEWNIKSSTSGTRFHVIQGYNSLLYHCATLPLIEIVWQHYLSLPQYLFTFVNTVLEFLSNLWGLGTE